MNQVIQPEQLYTPAMMAHMLGISVRAIRIWQRARLIQPRRLVMKVPYFGYSELSTAKTFSQWMRQGLTAQSIVQQLNALHELRGDSSPDSDMPISLEGKRLVLTSGSLQLESSGQLQIPFGSELLDDTDEPITLKFSTPANETLCTDDTSLRGMLAAASLAEESDDVESAIQWYRTALTAYGPNAEVSFQLAELLYRIGDLSAARERYYCAIELDPELMEARANLGCVLAECGQLELSVAAFQGALNQYPEYTDIHFHLARVLEDLGRAQEARSHWQKFLELAPASPWADEALLHLAD